MIHSRFNNNRIKNLHKRCLQLKPLVMKKSLEKDGSVSIPYTNKHSNTSVEMFKTKNGMSP